MRSNRVRLLVELLAWGGLFFFPIVLFPGFWPRSIGGGLNIIFIGLALTNFLLIGFYYLNYYVLLPRFYYAKRYFIYVSALLVCLALMLLILVQNPAFNPLPSPPFRFAQGAFIGSIMVRFIMIFLLSLGINYYNRLKRTEQEKIKAELSYLKAQINPHFLFNTLNSIYALTVKKSDHAPESVARLSTIMRYVITDASHEWVPLEKEIEYITNYIELEELRLTAKVKLDYRVTGELSGRQIAPLIFLPYIENAFKHGVSTRENSYIEIRIEITGTKLHLLVKNAKVHTHTISHGLGMENSRQRLQLLYPGRHELLIDDSEKDFSVSLKLSLE